MRLSRDNEFARAVAVAENHAVRAACAYVTTVLGSRTRLVVQATRQTENKSSRAKVFSKLLQAEGNIPLTRCFPQKNI